MTPEVKERIEQIRHGHVPEGYTRTKYGVFPHQWGICQLDQLLAFKNGINADKEKFGQGTKLISVRDILANHPITCDTIQGAVSVTHQQLEEFRVDYGDILFQRSSENYEDAGTSNVYLDPDNTAVFSGFVIRGKKKAEYDPVYLNALLRTYYVRKQIIRQAAGAQRINIGQESLAKVCIAVADSFEQKKIAEFLSTQDKITELKESLLAEKQRQKKYLMQQLLTGRKRLPGFDEGWKSMQLGQICKPTRKRNCVGNTNVMTISAQFGLINQEEFFHKAIASDDKSNYYLLYRDDFAYNKSYSSGYPYGAIKRLTNYDSGIVSPLYICFRVKRNDVSVDYMEHYFESGLMNRELQSVAQEGARNHGLLNIAVEDFFSATISLPPYDEQMAIAGILSTAEREIILLRQELEQENQKKKALMQLLLTGIVRTTEDKNPAKDGENKNGCRNRKSRSE